MNKGNLIRVIIWGTVWLIALAAAIVGLISYNGGHGVLGAVKHDMEPIVDNFNKMSGLKKYSDVGILIKSKIKDTNVYVSYNTGVSTASFKFEYQDLAGEKVLYMKYSSADEAVASVVVKFMIEAVSITNGHEEGKVFEKYTLENFTKTGILQGVQIKNTTSGTVVYINIAKSILDANIDNNNNVPEDNIYITEEDLVTITDDLSKTNGKFTATKGNILLYVTKKDRTYTILAQDITGEYSTNLYNSLKETIKVLFDETTYQSFVNNYPSITTSRKFDNFVITTDADDNNNTFFKSKTKIIKIEVTNKKA